LENGTQVHKEVFRLFPHHIQLQVNILITKYGFQTLINIVINDLTNPNMVQYASSTTTRAMIITNKKKTRSYKTLGYDFITFAINF
jgi:hypothetical protein